MSCLDVNIWFIIRCINCAVLFCFVSLHSVDMCVCGFVCSEDFILDLHMASNIILITMLCSEASLLAWIFLTVFFLKGISQRFLEKLL